MKKETILIIIALVVSFALLFVSYSKHTEKYNNGACQCGGCWKLVDVEQDKNGTPTYYYECNECDNTLRTSFRMK